MPLSSVVGAQSIVKPGVCTSSTRPASPYDGQVIYMTDVDQTAVWDGTQWTVLAPIAGGRNVVINGAFSVNQRNFSSTTGSTVYGFDRWSFAYSGGTTTSSAQVFALGSGPSANIESRNFWRIASTGQSAVGDLCFAYQFIEDVRILSSRTVTVSFYAKATTGTPKVAVEIGQKFGSGGSPSSDVNTYAGQITLSTSWSRYSVTVSIPSISGKTIGTDANSSSTVLYLWTSAGSNYNSRTGSIGIQNNTFDFWGIQLEVGAVATPFEFEDYGTTLAKCQRYFQNLVAYDARGGAWATTAGYMSKNLPVTMRATPTATLPTTGLTNSIDEIGIGSRTPTSFISFSSTPDRYSFYSVNIATLNTATAHIVYMGPTIPLSAEF